MVFGWDSTKGDQIFMNITRGEVSVRRSALHPSAAVERAGGEGGSPLLLAQLQHPLHVLLGDGVVILQRLEGSTRAL